MGTEIARAHLRAGIAVRLVDQSDAALAAAVGQLGDDVNASAITSIDWARCHAVGLVPAESTGSESTGSGPTTSPDVTADDIVIESIAENLPAKRSCLQSAWRQLGDSVVLASNTSTLRITDLASGAPYAHRLAGMHFFMPVVERLAVEIPVHPGTQPDIVDAITWLAGRLGCRGIEVPDSPGFVVNRMLSPYLNECLLMLCEGVDAETLRRAALDYGMPLSPLELIDFIGCRTMFDAGRVFWQAFPKRIDPAPILGRMIKSGRLGRSVGKGFFDYRRDGARWRRSRSLADEVLRFIDQYSRKPISANVDRVRDRMMWSMRLEADCLKADHNVTVETIDAAMAGGLGFHAASTWSARVNELEDSRIQWLLDHVAPFSAAMRLDKS